MPSIERQCSLPPELLLGARLTPRVPAADQKRQRAEVEEILRRLRYQPGVILGDEVGMGKTYVALAVAYSVAMQSLRGPVVVMVPSHLVEKWEQDFKTFCELYLDSRHPIRKDRATRRHLVAADAVRYGVARHSVELLKLLDDPARERCHLIFLALGAMQRRQTDKWIRLALVSEALRRHGRGRADRLIAVKDNIHRFLAELLWATGEQRVHDLQEELWPRLMRTDPRYWKELYNKGVRKSERQLVDDPVPKAVVRALDRIDLHSLAEALKEMPVRASGGEDRVSERIDVARKALRQAEGELWRDLLTKARWQSPLLVMDEAHHLKNPDTAVARQLQSPDLEEDLRTGDGAMARAFDRMLFLTATPFQLGHRELVRVLERFGDVRWDTAELGDKEVFCRRLKDLGSQLDESQRSSIALQRSWCRLRPEDCTGNPALWWSQLGTAPRESLTCHQRAVMDAYKTAKQCRDAAEESLRPWIVRHNKGAYWPGSQVKRRERKVGAAIAGQEADSGLQIPPHQLLPFFLAARSVTDPGKDLLGEALCSSYEAFRFTRENRDEGKDEQDDQQDVDAFLCHSAWYLDEFDRALKRSGGSDHPKIDATVRKVVDLWEAGEKVLVFAFYRHTCRSLRIHISREIERRVTAIGQGKLNAAARDGRRDELELLVERIQRRYFDDIDSPGRRALDMALAGVLEAHTASLDAAQVSAEQREMLIDVMRRFLRVATTLVRCFPLAELDSMRPDEAVARTLDYSDVSGVSWHQKFDGFLTFLTNQCSSGEREDYIEAARRTQTRGIRVESGDQEKDDADTGQVTLANVQVATGDTDHETRQRLMRAFNTPFFPDILVCSQVMGEGVDLQRFCRHVIHHDLAWNPSSIEQRTGRIDRLGCKAEGRHPIVVYLPYLAGTADERQYKVMSDREQWFRVVMGQDEVAKLIAPDCSTAIPLPDAVSEQLSFKLGL